MKEYPEEQAEKYRQEYINRKRRRLLSTVPFFFFAAIALIARLNTGGFFGIPFSIAGPVAYATLLAVVVFRIVDWRCPVCNKILSLDSNPKFCQKCGFKLH
jgi:rubrerythrin